MEKTIMQEYTENPNLDTSLSPKTIEIADKFMEENKELMDDLAGTAPNASTPEEVLDIRSPEEIEAEFLKKAEEDAQRMAENRDPAETAAIMFHMFYPQFKNLTMGLSNKELRRLVTALIGKGHATEPDTPRFNNQNTGQAYKMGLELLQAKFMMIQRLELDAFEKAHAEKEEAKILAEEAIVTTEYSKDSTESNTNVSR